MLFDKYKADVTAVESEILHFWNYFMWPSLVLYVKVERSDFNFRKHLCKLCLKIRLLNHERASVIAFMTQVPILHLVTIDKKRNRIKNFLFPHFSFFSHISPYNSLWNVLRSRDRVYFITLGREIFPFFFLQTSYHASIIMESLDVTRLMQFWI